MSRLPRRPHHNRNRFPRVSGDEPTNATTTVTPELFSPRERG